LILGTPPSDVEAWAGVNWSAVGYSSDWLSEADVVVLPAYIEHQPRAALEAIAAGIPVVASTACGLTRVHGVKEVEAGDVDAIERAVTQALADVRAEA
jgi:glycosyltransferase involved in cell wall biosynthesis